MLNELAKVIEEFDTLTDDELGFYEGELLRLAFYAEGEIMIETNYYSKPPYVKIGNQHYNFDPRTNANYRSGLARTIRKGFVDQWCGNSFLLTKKGWDQAVSIVENMKKHHCK